MQSVKSQLTNQLPDAFVGQMNDLLGVSEADALFEALGQTSPTSVRLNPGKQAAPSGFPDSSPVPWCADGLYLAKRPAFTLDPLFHAGTYYVQEASSMFLAHVLHQFIQKPAVALDLCAAPGGKSTLTLAHLPEGSLLVANEAIRQRAYILAENLTKWGNPNIIVTNNYAEDFQPLGAVFDLIICDAPCSGEGMFRKDPDSISQWSMANVETCWKRQRDIVANAWPCLRPGGLFIYSTCTYNTAEDELMAEWIAKELDAEPLDCQAPADWHITGNLLRGSNLPVYRFLPHRTCGEGFFLCAFRKREDDDNCAPAAKLRKEKTRGNRQAPAVPKELHTYLTDSASFLFSANRDGTIFTAFPKNYQALYEAAQQQLNVLHAGVQLAELKGKNKIQPSHSLALSNNLNSSTFEKSEIDKETALAYLRCESITLPSDIAHGYVLVCYEGHPLGFVNNLGSRANNLYPHEWRIKRK